VKGLLLVGVLLLLAVLLLSALQLLSLLLSGGVAAAAAAAVCAGPSPTRAEFIFWPPDSHFERRVDKDDDPGTLVFVKAAFGKPGAPKPSAPGSCAGTAATLGHYDRKKQGKKGRLRGRLPFFPPVLVAALLVAARREPTKRSTSLSLLESKGMFFLTLPDLIGKLHTKSIIIS